MRIKLSKRPKNPTIIQGFPGFGLVSTIATEFLIDHLKTEQIGKIEMPTLPAMIAVHEGRVIEPIGIFYNKKYNIIIVHVVSSTTGLEWKLGDAVVELAKELKAKEIISLEGIGSTEPLPDSRAYYYASDEARKKALSTIAQPLKEGIIMGLTGVLMLRAEKVLPISCIFAEAHSEMPDSKAAAKVIEMLDKYLGLKIDYKPLLQQAEKFEEKLKQLLTKTKEMSEEQRKKKLSYLG